MVLIELLPVALSILVLGAHFFRAGNLLLVAACAGLLILLAVRRPWAARILQAALLLGGLEWGRTLYELAMARSRAGEPFVRLVVILGCVGLVTLLSALMFFLPAAKTWYRITGPQSGAGRS